MASRCLAAALACGAFLAGCGRPAPAESDQALDAQLAAARALQLKEGPRAAVPVYERVIASARGRQDRRHEALALGQLGIAYKNLAEYDHALELQRQALAIKRDLGDEIEIGKTLTNMGLIEEAQGNCAAALELYAQSLTIFTRLHAPQFQASVLNNQGLCYDALGDFRQSAVTYQKALALHRDAGNDVGESQALGNLGGVALLLGRYAEAATDYEQALAISTKLDAKQSMALDLINLGLARTGTGEFSLARTQLERARDIAHEAGLPREEADARKGLANLLAEFGKYDQARQAVEAAIASYTQAGLAKERVDATSMRGELDLAMGDLGRSATAFTEASAEAGRLKYHSGRLSAELALAELELRRQNPEAAAAHALQAQASATAAGDQSSQASALIWLAQARKAEGHLDDALDACRTAVKAASATGSPVSAAEARIALGDVLLASKQPASAISEYDAVLNDSAVAVVPDLAWRASFGRGQSREALGRLDDALSDYLQSVRTIESVRSQLASESARTGFLDDKRDVYVLLVRVLLRLGRTKEAFQAAERLRTEGYRALVQRSLALGSANGNISAALLARIRQLQAAVDDELKRPSSERRGETVGLYRDELRDAERAWSDAVATLANQRVAQVLRTSSAISIPEIQRRLSTGSALIEYVVGRDETNAFLLTATAIHALPLPVGQATLRTRIELFRGLLSRHETDGWQDVAERLDADLIDPIRRAGWLKGATRLYVVPIAELNYLPFAALRHKVSGQPRLLVDDLSPIILPAAAALLDSGRPAPPGNLLALAPSRTHLQFARDEVRSIGALFSGSEVLQGPDATEERFKADAGRYRVLHLATHGFFNRVDPLFSGVELEPSAHDDGQLQVFEILGLRLSANLVTLSACDTALGGGELSDLPAGEELIGLTRAFLSAGSNNVLATLWDVDDRATAALMADFYRAAQTRSFPEALAAVQRDWAHRPDPSGHPWHWAAFTIAEGWRPRPDTPVTGP